MDVESADCTARRSFSCDLQLHAESLAVELLVGFARDCGFVPRLCVIALQSNHQTVDASYLGVLQGPMRGRGGARGGAGGDRGGAGRGRGRGRGNVDPLVGQMVMITKGKDRGKIGMCRSATGAARVLCGWGLVSPAEAVKPCVWVFACSGRWRVCVLSVLRPFAYGWCGDCGFDCMGWRGPFATWTL